MIQQKYPCLILCAGTSKRFGSDKMFAPLGGRSVLSHVIEIMRGQVSTLALNAPRTKEYQGFGLPVLEDVIGGGIEYNAEASLGPLAGVLTAMEWAKNLGENRVLTVSGDTPFLPTDLANQLSLAPKGHIATPFIKDRAQRICSLWPVEIATHLRAYLENCDDLRVGVFMQAYENSEVLFDMDKGVNPFFNINSPQDLKNAEKANAEKYLAASVNHQ